MRPWDSRRKRASLSICGKMRTRVRLWERCKNNQHKIAKEVLNRVLMLLCVKNNHISVKCTYYPLKSDLPRISNPGQPRINIPLPSPHFLEILVKTEGYGVRAIAIEAQNAFARMLCFGQVSCDRWQNMRD